MKGKKILIISIIVILVIALVIGGVVFAFMTTDILKTDEQLFYKYMADIGLKASNMASKELDDYLTKMQTTAYANESKLTVNVEMPKEMQDKMKKGYVDKINDINITFSGKVDNPNKRSIQDININYSDSVTFPIKYKKDNNLYAATSEKLLKSYLAVKNENLQKVGENFGLNESNVNIEIPNSMDTSILQMKQSDIVNEIMLAKSIIEQNVTEANFSKIDDNSYALTLSERETINILSQIIGQLKQSNNISKNMKDTLDGSLKKMNALNVKDTELVQIIVKKDGKITIMVKGTKALEVQVRDTEIVMTSRIEKTEFQDAKDISVVLRKTGEGARSSIFSKLCDFIRRK